MHAKDQPLNKKPNPYQHKQALSKRTVASKSNTNITKTTSTNLPKNSSQDHIDGSCIDCKLHNLRLNDFVQMVKSLTRELQLCKDIIEVFMSAKIQLTIMNNNYYTENCNIPEHISVINQEQKSNQKSEKICSETITQQNHLKANYRNNLIEKLVGNSIKDIFTESTDYQSFVASQAKLIEQLLESDLNEVAEGCVDEGLLHKPNEEQTDDKDENPFETISYKLDLQEMFDKLLTNALDEKDQDKPSSDRYRQEAIEVLKTEHGFEVFNSRLGKLLRHSDVLQDIHKGMEYLSLNQQIGVNGLPNKPNLDFYKIIEENRYDEMIQELAKGKFQDKSKELGIKDKVGFGQEGRELTPNPRTEVPAKKNYHKRNQTMSDNYIGLLPEKSYRNCETCHTNIENLQRNLHYCTMKKIITSQKKMENGENQIHTDKGPRHPYNVASFGINAIPKAPINRYESNKKTAKYSSIGHSNYSGNKSQYSSNLRKGLEPDRRNHLSIKDFGSATKKSPVLNTEGSGDGILLQDFFDVMSPHHPNYWTNIGTGMPHFGKVNLGSIDRNFQQNRIAETKLHQTS